MPNWMMKDLFLEEGSSIKIQEINLPLGKFAKFQPLSNKFYKMKSPDYALQLSLSTFTTLTTGQTIPIFENEKSVLLYVVETSPASAICIQTRRGDYIGIFIHYIRFKM
jgi:hypothetical protein